MKRLRNMGPVQLKAWADNRMAVGERKYGDWHLRRYGLVDVVEELLDAQNIIHLLRDRVRKDVANVDNYQQDNFLQQIQRLEKAIQQAVDYAQIVDETLPNGVCTDEHGGKRIWWNE